jgi:hypothetical protein
MKAIELLLVVVGLISFATSHLNAGEMEDRFGGNEYVALIEAPTSVKAWRTVGSLKSYSTDLKDFYRKSGKAKLVSTNLVVQLSKVLLDKTSYSHFGGPGKECRPFPSVILTFSNGKRDLDLFFCFECKVLVVKAGADDKGTPVELRGGSDFDASYVKFARIMKKIFPKDTQIQSLNEEE